MFLFLGLTALFAALRRRISALIEECLIFSSKREWLSAIATDEFLIPSHVSSFRPCFNCVLHSKYIECDYLRSLLKIAVHRAVRFLQLLIQVTLSKQMKQIIVLLRWQVSEIDRHGPVRARSDLLPVVVSG
ncbi:MAG TPA: hypothetical protein VMU57_21895 [Edaphobacter sp.]|nr:hypothetical protein [Edaphobacter sp.]